MTQSKPTKPAVIGRYEGIRNPSCAIALDDEHFIVADDEDNSLRIYHRYITSDPLQIIPLQNIFDGKIKIGKGQEIDLEGAAELGGLYFWIGSHSTNRDGKARPARHRLFAVRVEWDVPGVFSVSAEGDIYKNLLKDLAQDPRFADYGFDKAKKLPPKAPGGLSIEGLAATRAQGLLIGFRNPLSGGTIDDGRLVGGKALLVHLLNPFEVIAGKAACFADPIELDLDGLGIRDMVLRKKQKYLIAAGPYYDSGELEDRIPEQHRLYAWSLKSGKLKRLDKIALGDLNIEAAFFYQNDNKTVQLLSDDGKVDGAQGFRSVLVKI